jgi:hypothetical protein
MRHIKASVKSYPTSKMRRRFSSCDLSKKSIAVVRDARWAASWAAFFDISNNLYILFNGNSHLGWRDVVPCRRPQLTSRSRGCWNSPYMTAPQIPALTQTLYHSDLCILFDRRLRVLLTKHCVAAMILAR